MQGFDNIDNIERSKMQLYKDTGNHLSVTLYANRVELTITKNPIHPIMLPIAKSSKWKNPFDFKVSKQIKVTKG